MDLDKGLIESGKRKQQRSWSGITGSLLVHGAIFGLVAALSLNAEERVDAEDKAIPVYMEQAAAPPPPPPPPPPAGAPARPQRATPKIEQPQPVEVPKFVAPTEVPKTVPVEQPSADPGTEETPAEPLPAGAPIGGVAGGVEGGTVGGELGGQIGGVIGGVQGGVVGGTPGGVLGGTPGGTGTAPAAAPAPAPAPPPPPPPAAGPVRVGGNVSAPSVVSRFEPKYTEAARRSRVTGVVIVEAIIDKNGNVDNVRVIKGLPMGLSEAAADAVRRWKFRPGMQHGRPVDVIFNLTVMFTLGNDGPKVGGVSRPQPRQQRPQPTPQRQDPPVAAEEPAPAPVEAAPAAEEPPAEAPAESTDPSTP